MFLYCLLNNVNWIETKDFSYLLCMNTKYSIAWHNGTMYAGRSLYVHIYRRQFGALKGRSTTHALVSLLHSWATVLDSGGSVRTVNNNNNTLIYIAPACRMTSEALADSSSRATECLTEK